MLDEKTKAQLNSVAKLHLMSFDFSNQGIIEPITAAGLHADFTKHVLSAEVWNKLIDWSEQAQLSQRIEAYFSGEKVNVSESRSALHTALRRPYDRPLLVDGYDVMQDIASAHRQMQTLVEDIQQGAFTGRNGEPIQNIVNIGIGGSDLGPKMVSAALQEYANKSLKLHFIANVDEAYTRSQLASIDPASTLVVMVSKSFSTAETLSNADLVRQWMQTGGLNEAQCVKQFVAVTANIEAARVFGIAPEYIFPMWDFVGGRFSVWSAVGLTLSVSLGMQQFKDFLAGAYEMDQHFRHAPLAENMPVVMGLLGAWYGNFCHCATQAIIPYSDYLRFFPDYLQQLHMESLGKRVKANGEEVSFSTGKIIWGGVGSNTQHSFHQLLMQGTYLTPVDFILPIKDYRGQLNTKLIANCFAQSQVLWRGTQQDALLKESDECLENHREIPGRCPSTTILMQQLTPASLGALIALYEHKVFVQSVLWEINAFDQWGVEQGKLIASDILAVLQAGQLSSDVDPVTGTLLQIVFEKESS